MKSQHWTDFENATDSLVDRFYGGIHPPYTYDKMNVEKGFAAVQYRLLVNSAHNGWHHFMGMYTSVQGVAFSNAMVKEALKPGYYQFMLHFDFIKPAYNPASGPQNIIKYEENCLRTSLFYGQDSNTYDTSKTWANGNLMDIMVFRPTLVDPTNANNFQLLWNSNSSIYNGWQMYFTGFPLADPILVNSSVYEL